MLLLKFVWYKLNIAQKTREQCFFVSNFISITCFEDYSFGDIHGYVTTVNDTNLETHYST